MEQYPQPWRRKGAKYYYFSYLDASGRRISKSTGKDSKREARIIIEEFINQLRARTLNVTLGEYCKPYYVWDTCPLIRHRLDEKKSIGKAHVHIQRKKLENYIFPDRICSISLQNLRRGHILDFRSRLRKQVSDSTANQVIGVLKAILKEAFFRGDIDRDPTAGIGRIRVEKREIGTFTRPELEDLFDSEKKYFVEKRHRIAYLIMAETGMRPGEILALRWMDINWERRVIEVSRAVKYWGIAKEIGPPKWGKNRTVAMTARLEEELHRYLEDVLTCRPESLIVCWDDGTIITMATFKRWFRKAVSNAGIDAAGRNLSPYSFRHTRITHLKQSGVPLDVIKAQVGHVEDTTTEGYTHFEDSYLVEEIRRIE